MSYIKQHLDDVMDALESRNFSQALELVRGLGEDRDTIAQSLLTAIECLAEVMPPMELASQYLPSEIKSQTLSPSTLRVIANDLERQGISGLNVALALDLIVGN